MARRLSIHLASLKTEIGLSRRFRSSGFRCQGGIAVGGIAPDRNSPEACWFWVVADNVRLMAENAVAVARQLL